jgi:type I restriction enzyme S subunit
MIELPENWTKVPLLTVSDLVRGVTYSKGDARSEPFTGSIPVLRANNIQDRGFRLADLVHVPKSLVSDKQHVGCGDVVVATSSGSISVVGKAAQALENMNVGFGAFCGLLRPNKAIHAPYFGFFFSSDDYRKAVSAMARGVNINNLKRGHFESLELPLPPLAEQKRIADKLEAVLGRVDACRTRLDRVPALLKRFRQSVLAAATSGKLTEEWRTTRKIDGASKRFEIGEDALDVPKSWEKGVLRDLLDPSRPLCYGVVQPGEETAGGALLIRVQDLENGSVNIDDLRTISKSVDLEYKRSRIQEGDLLISVVGTIGRTALVPANLDANIARAVARLACRKGVDSRWLNYWLSCDTLQWWLSSSSKEVARKTLNLSELGNAPVALPPPDEQTEIVRRVETLFAFADRIEARLAAAQATVERLTPSTLAKAFRGELVPQDPDDEPAAALLERTRRQTTAKPGREIRKHRVHRSSERQ